MNIYQLDLDSQTLFLDYVTNLTQIVAILIGILIAAFQIRKGYEDSLNLQKENIKQEHFSRLHTEIELIVDQLLKTQSAFSGALYSIDFAFGTGALEVANGRATDWIKVTSQQELNAKSYDLQMAIVGLISVVERYEIIEPRLKIFQLAFNVTSHDVRTTFAPLMSKLSNVLPNEAGVSHIPFRMPNQRVEAEIRQQIDLLRDALGDVSSYTMDLRVEIQNLLLSDLFDRKLNRRKPLDPRFKVISTEQQDYLKLETYFMNETAWGREYQETNARVIASLNSTPGNNASRAIAPPA